MDSWIHSGPIAYWGAQRGGLIKNSLLCLPVPRKPSWSSWRGRAWVKTPWASGFFWKAAAYRALSWYVRLTQTEEALTVCIIDRDHSTARREDLESRGFISTMYREVMVLESGWGHPALYTLDFRMPESTHGPKRNCYSKDSDLMHICTRREISVDNNSKKNQMIYRKWSSNIRYCCW